MEGFEYVVNPPEVPKIAFGSGLERETLPMEGPSMTPFQRRHQPELRYYPGPSDYDMKDGLDIKYPCKLGHSAFASKVPRPPVLRKARYPPVGTYDVDKPKPAKKPAKPFGSGAKAKPDPISTTPGPSTYPYHVPLQQPKLCMAFGSARIHWPAVAVFCGPHNTAKCMKCGSTPLGDYWHHFSKNQDMCRACMNDERWALSKCETEVMQRVIRRRELAAFAQVRYCDFYHDHNGTKVTVQIMPKSILRYKVTKENYLHLFRKDY